jgi:hypothetical protein
MLARAHVANRTGLLAIACEAGRGQGIERHAFGAGRDQGLAHSRSAVHALEGPNVEVLAGMRAGHQGDLGRLEIEGLDPARLDQGDDAEGLDAAPQVGDPIGIAEPPDQAPVDVGLDHVAAVDALLDATAHLTDEDRGRPPGGSGR